MVNIPMDPRNANYESTQLDLSLDEWQQSARRWLDPLKTNQKAYSLPWKRLYETHMFGSNTLTRPWAVPLLPTPIGIDASSGWTDSSAAFTINYSTNNDLLYIEVLYDVRAQIPPAQLTPNTPLSVLTLI
jgi:hypothetical protein